MGLLTALLAVLASCAVTLLPSCGLNQQQGHRPVMAATANSNGAVRGLTVQNGLVQSVNFGLIKSSDLDNGQILAAATYGDPWHIPQISIDAAGRLTRFVSQAMQVRDAGGQAYNVLADKYGLIGDNVHDDTAGLQSAINDALASGGTTLYLPPPAVAYRVTSTITIQPPTGQSQALLAVCCPGGGNATSGSHVINYVGASGTPCFAISNLAWCKLHNLSVQIGQNVSGGVANNHIAFDFQFSAANNNVAHPIFEHCNVVMTGTGQGHIGFRFGQDATGRSAGTALLIDCNVTGADSSAIPKTSTFGGIGFQLGGSQMKPLTFLHCGGALLGQVVLAGPIATTLSGTGINATITTVPVLDASLLPPAGTVQVGSGTPEQITYTGTTATSLTGCTRGANNTTAQSWGGGSIVQQYVTNQGVYLGANAFTWLGGSFSNNGFSNSAAGTAGGGDFQLVADGTFSIFGPRLEAGYRLLQAGIASANNYTRNIVLAGATAESYTLPADGNGIFWLQNNANLRFSGGTLTAQSGTFGATMLTNNGAPGPYGSIVFDGCRLTATYPYWTVVNNWPVKNNATLHDASGAAVGSVDQSSAPVVTLADAATVTVDLSQSDIFLLPLTAAVGANRTLATSNGLPGQKFKMLLQQPASGGPCTVTWWNNIRWQGGTTPILTTTASKIDRAEFELYSSGNYLGTSYLNY